MNVSSGVVSDCVLALDQGMIMAAMANVLADDAMQRAFVDGPFEAAIRPLIAQEEFTARGRRLERPARPADRTPGAAMRSPERTVAQAAGFMIMIGDLIWKR